ncbi:redoxin domain-containing protein [Spongiibacter marinus]|uniref:redoxin domain-containing protein n=1 Tax=Spongiibacter marinus TaxID=354246 RepID=UPI0035BE2155
MTTPKLEAGMPFPSIHVTAEDQTTRDITAPQNGCDWMMIVVYRGKHCPLCTRYLNSLEEVRETLKNSGVDIAAVSADSPEQLAAHKAELKVNFPLYTGLSVEQMQALGLYISDPRSAQETDHPFAEPGIFVINAEGQLHVADISNNPFVRPEISTLVSGLRWIRDPDNNYPVRGKRAYQ